MLGKKLINAGPVSSGANTFASENFNTVLYTGNGGTQRIGGYINRGAVFNGSSSYIDLGNNSSNNGSLISVSCWFRTTSTSAAMVWNNGGNDSSSTGLALKTLASGVLYFQANTGGTNVNDTGTTTINDGDWHHVVVNYDNGDFNVYLDGSSTAELTGTSSAFTTTANRNFIIGRLSRVATDYFNGVIDQFRIFNRELTTSEVTTLYGETHASTTISTTDIFSDNSGVALYQLDGNANDTGGVSGKFGAGGIFNGSNADIDLPSGMQSSTMTVSLWMYLNATEIGSIVYEFSNGYGLHFLSGQSGKVSAQYANSNNSHILSNSAISTGQWVHIVGVHTSSSSKLYVNGTLQSGGSAADFYTCDQNTIGSRRSGEFFEGRLDDIRIYSDELTSTEVGYIYNNTTASIPTDNLLAYYKLDGDARDEQQLYDGVATNVTYAYDGTATNVTYQEATSFTPDLVWIKNRSSAQSHRLVDSVRGDYNLLFPDLTNANDGPSSSYPSIESNGFALNSTESNASSTNYVAWCFKGGGTAVSNTDGTITSSVSANQDAGFSIVKYSGNTGADQTVGHGLSSTPEMVIVKRLTDAGYSWCVQHIGLTSMGYNLYLDSSSGELLRDRITAWDSTTFTVEQVHETNNTGKDYIAYCFHSVDGYSKIGSYTGTGTTNGNFVETGFEPAFVMVKRTDGGAQNWVMFDNKRSTTNPRTKKLAANLSSDENNSGTIGTDAQDNLDFYADGFRPVTSNNHTNISGGTFIYLAIAADPDTTTPTVENSFDVVTYTGNGTTSQIVDVDFKPDLVWVKARGLAQAPNIFDSIRGGELLRTSSTSASFGDYIDYVDDGFQFKVTDAGWNQSSQNYVAWCWKAGDHDDNLPQINTEGSIDSVVSVNADAGFSIVKYRGTASVGATVGHGLSSTPELYIIKETSAADDWMVVAKIGSSYQRGKLNTSDAFSTAMSGVTNNVDPTSTAITLGNSGSVNQSGQDYIGYFFHSVSGYQKIGSYDGGTLSSSNIENVGFRPRFVMLKQYEVSGNHWVIYDTVRDATNPHSNILYPNLSNQEAISTTDNFNLYLTDNGFYFNNTVGYLNNTTSGDVIYLAIK